MQRVTVKTSTIFIAKAGRTRVYRSVDEVPASLRKELEVSTNSFNSATILIADRRGREEIIRALNGLPSTLRSRLASSLTPKNTAANTLANKAANKSTNKNGKPGHVPLNPTRVMAFLQRNWLEISLPVAVGLIVWAAFNYRS
jgi:topoisomerase IA-like protein